ncbi:DUF2513 domain-containing protein [Streptococcus dysgalactiae]|nr:DUF2513 domain-containing protein [Streptococcus dysgalactiae]
MNGHQFLDSVRSPKVWRETKKVAGKFGVFSSISSHKLPLKLLLI